MTENKRDYPSDFNQVAKAIYQKLQRAVLSINGPIDRSLAHTPASLYVSAVSKLMRDEVQERCRALRRGQRSAAPFSEEPNEALAANILPDQGLTRRVRRRV